MDNNNENNPTIPQLLAIRNELKNIAQKIDKLSNQDNKDDSQELLLGHFKPLSLIAILLFANTILIFANILTQIQQNFIIFSLANKPKSYEYTIFSPSDESFESQMDSKGIEGWKAVSCRRASDRLTDTFGYECIMMREIQ